MYLIYIMFFTKFYYVIYKYMVDKSHNMCYYHQTGELSMAHSIRNKTQKINAHIMCIIACI